MFKNSFSLDGRIRRLEYGLSFIISYGILAILSILESFLSCGTPVFIYPVIYFIGLIIFGGGLFSIMLAINFLTSGGGSVVLLLFFLGFSLLMFWFLVSQGTKRCQDLGRSLWWQLIPFYGFWLLFKEGDKNANKYGENPKCQNLNNSIINNEK